LFSREGDMQVTKGGVIRTLEELECLADKVYSLFEAEELAREVRPEMLPELRKLIYASLRKVRALARTAFRGRSELGAIGPNLPLEVYERYFAVLRDLAEMQWVRTLKLTGKEARKARTEADSITRLAHDAAISLKIVAESRGAWTVAYASKHGVDTWL